MAEISEVPAPVAESTAAVPVQDAPPDYGSSETGRTTIREAVVAARRISTADDQSTVAAHSGHDRQGPNMPVVSPATLLPGDKRREFFELPPPPPPSPQSQTAPPSPSAGAVEGPVLSDELAFAPAVTEPPYTPSPPNPSSTPSPSDRLQASLDRADRAKERLLKSQLEAEIIGLRREIERLAESQRIASQLDRMELAHEELLRLHQELPIDQMMQLLHVLLAELQSVREATARSNSGASFPSGADLEGEASPADRGRISLRISEAQLEDVIRMLSTLSGTPIFVDPEPKRVDRSDEGPQLVPQEADEPPDVTSSTPQFLLPLPAAAPTASALSKSSKPLTSSRESIRQVAATSRCAQCHPHHIPR
ncbi:MAG: hypothetical protein AB7U20_10585 [Planctomycetaceae bacterium]